MSENRRLSISDKWAKASREELIAGLKARIAGADRSADAIEATSDEDLAWMLTAMDTGKTRWD